MARFLALGAGIGRRPARSAADVQSYSRAEGGFPRECQRSAWIRVRLPSFRSLSFFSRPGTSMTGSAGRRFRLRPEGCAGELRDTRRTVVGSACNALPWASVRADRSVPGVWGYSRTLRGLITRRVSHARRQRRRKSRFVKKATLLAAYVQLDRALVTTDHRRYHVADTTGAVSAGRLPAPPGGRGELVTGRAEPSPYWGLVVECPGTNERVHWDFFPVGQARPPCGAWQRTVLRAFLETLVVEVGPA